MTHEQSHPNIAASSDSTPRELDSRSNDGIHVRLLWHPQTSRVSVTVTDSKTGEAFELDVREGHRPLDVFHHPYAYAAAENPGTHHAGSKRCELGV
jgi:hypothetical protein